MAFSPRDRATIEALADAIAPAGGPLPSARDVRTAATVERYLGMMDRRQASRLTWLVRAFSALPVVTGRLRRFRHLPDARRERFLATLTAAGGYRKQLYGALKQFVVTAWASSPEVARAMGREDGCLADAPDRDAYLLGYLPAEPPGT